MNLAQTPKETVLIAGLSARATAAAARRAGFLPLVVDAFGDSDTRELAHKVQTIPDAYKRGFHSDTLKASLAKLTNSVSKPPIGLVLSAGFEDRPDLVADLEDRYKILGCASGTIKACKDPYRFAETLQQYGIPTPDISEQPPKTNSEDWIVKRLGGTGGAHIQHASSGHTAKPGTYFQRVVTGKAYGFLFVADPVHNHIQAVGITEQWCSPIPSASFRYGGAVGPCTSSLSRMDDLLYAAGKLMQAFQLIGLVSLDFIDDGSRLVILEINPRPAPTLDIFDTANGDLFKAHIAAAHHTSAHRIETLPAQRARASAYLYADHGDLTVKTITWPSWTADRPIKGTKIPHGQPIATVFSEAQTIEDAKTLCLKRLDTLSSMVYCPQKEEAQQ